ncbi:MAG: isoleucine--tRNA ligase [Candidatus Omnitrophota bacterium]
MEYKDTLNLPKTDFPMKAGLPKREPVFLEGWQKQDIYRLIRQRSLGKEKYILHDGPPYANGDIHIGHALNKTLKDIIVKYKTMRGFDSAYVPGWDCHGLPIEHKLFKELKINKLQISQIEFRKQAGDYALQFVAKQKEQFKRLGVFADWENPYLTLSRDYERKIVESFRELFLQGYIQRGLKPVNWCFKCETALAEAEVEYENHTSPSVYVKFKLEDKEGFLADSYLLIWTTTPWTLLANMAVAVHPDLVYSCVKCAVGNLIIAKDLLSVVLAQGGINQHELIKEFTGRQLEGLIYKHPFGLRKGRVVSGEHVSKEEGTGLVHIAPGHGAEDYILGVKYKLEVVMPVDAQGNFDQTTGEFAGMNVYDANKLIIEKLINLGALFFQVKLEHSYPHCWRCKTPVIFRATKQWFLMIDHLGLRKKLLREIELVRWIPEAGKERLAAMVELRPDWCLSRQRYWGVPLPALRCENCREEFFDARVIDKFIAFIALEGSDSWFQREVEDFIYPGLNCPNCKENKFSKNTDILDVWFDSGVSWQAVLKQRQELGGIPCALYLEGSDQHRGWFQSSLIPAVAIEGKAPFKAVLTHGHVVDGAGRKMSKSLGNVTSPHDIIKDYGADILRLWVASSDYREDIRISKEMLARLSEAYRKIRNTIKFILSNLYDFDPARDRVSPEKLKKIDQWILFRLQQMLKKVSSAYESFDFHGAYKGIYDFCNEDLSMYYLDMIKGRLYTAAASSVERRAAQSAIYEALNIIIRVSAPILSFTAEEAWQYMPHTMEDKAVISVHLLDWPGETAEINLAIEPELKPALELIPEIAKALEQMRGQGIIGSSFDAQINLLTKDEIRYKSLISLEQELAEIYKVSQVSILKTDNLEGEVEVKVDIALGQKCPRCWNYSQVIGQSQKHPLLCSSCLVVLSKQE